MRRRKKKSETSPVPTKADERGSGTFDPVPVLSTKPVKFPPVGLGPMTSAAKVYPLALAVKSVTRRFPTLMFTSKLSGPGAALLPPLSHASGGLVLVGPTQPTEYTNVPLKPLVKPL